MFGVPSGKLLGFIVSSRGIEANPTKVNAIRFMKPPRSKKDLKKLTGCMAALSRFISRLGDRGLPFFKLLRKSDKFEWSDDASKAFQELMDFLTSPPVLTAPKDGEVLLLYIAATTSVTSTNAPSAEAAIRYPHHVKKAPALLPGSQDQGGLILSTR